MITNIRRRLAAAPGRDSGFTLVELLVAIVILAVIAVPVSNVVITWLLNSASASARMSESHDEQIAAAYWQQDVASTGVQTYNVNAQAFQTGQSVNAGFACGTPAGSTTLITLKWTEYDESGGVLPVGVAYVVDASGTELIRVSCRNGENDSTATLTHNLAGTPTCDFGAGFVPCASGSGTPASISIKLHISDPTGDGQPYDVTLTGQRRQT